MGRLTATTTSYAFPDGGANFTTSYGYDAAVEPHGVSPIPKSGSTSYVYDTLNRLQNADASSGFHSDGQFSASAMTR